MLNLITVLAVICLSSGDPDRMPEVYLDTIKTRIGIMNRVIVRDTIPLRTVRDTVYVPIIDSSPVKRVRDLEDTLKMARTLARVIISEYDSLSSRNKTLSDSLSQTRLSLAIATEALARASASADVYKKRCQTGGLASTQVNEAPPASRRSQLHQWINKLYTYATTFTTSSYEQVDVYIGSDSYSTTIVEYSLTMDNAFRYDSNVDCNQLTMYSMSSTEIITGSGFIGATDAKQRYLRAGETYYNKTTVQGAIIAQVCGIR